MRKIVILFIVGIMAFANRDAVAGRKVQWQKFMNDTAKKPYRPNWQIEGKIVDTSNNIYVAYSMNGNDTTMSVISKLSSSGEILWKKTVLPFNLNLIKYTRFAQSTHLYINKSQQLVFVTSGFDTSTGSFILLTKWDLNGNLIFQSIVPAYDLELNDIYITANDDIFTLQHVSANDSGYISVRGFNMNFTPIYTDLEVIYLGSNHFGGWMEVATSDSLVSFEYIIYSGQSRILFVVQKNLNTPGSNWVYTAPDPGEGQQMLEYEFGNLYLVGANGIMCFNINTGLLQHHENTYQIRRCIFDTLTNRIYGLSGSANYNHKMFVFNKELQLVNEATSSFMIGDFCKQGDIIQLLRYNGINYTNWIFTKRIDTNCNSIDEFPILFPNTTNYMFEHTSMLDFNRDLILFNVVYLNMFDSTLMDNIFAAPLFIQKICYNCAEDIKGRVFIEVEGNCHFDSIDLIVQDNLIHLLPEDIYTKTDSLGHYSFVKSTGIATVEYVPKFNATFPCSIPSYVVNMVNGANDTLDFGLIVELPTIDAASHIVAGQARPGFIQHIYLEAENFSTQKLYDTKLTLKIDSEFTFISADISPDSISGNLLFWFYDSLNPGTIKSYSLTVQVGSVNLGYQFRHISAVITNLDNNPLNNIDTCTGTVTGSYDPNYKLSSPVGIGPLNFIENNTLCNYYVEFQNVGTDTAFNIKILDDIDDDFDISSLVVKKASHPMYYKIVGRQLQFYFDNILLVDSNRDYKKSIGYVTYSIMPKKVADGTQLTNTAAIYFDFNEPVITNTTLYTIGRPGCLFDNENLNDFNFFPNPVNEQIATVTVNLASAGNYRLSISDIAGKEIYSEAGRSSATGKYQHRIDLSKVLNSGIYFITLHSSKNTQTKKMIYGN